MISPIRSPSSSPRKRKRDSEADEIEIDVSAPEPPSKKALRQAKKQSQPSKPNPAPPAQKKPQEQPEKAQESDEDPPGGSTRSEHGIWIGNLAFKTDHNDLRVFFAANSIFEKNITRLHLPAPKGGGDKSQEQTLKRKPANQGFAYVDFDSASTLAQALKLTESLLAGRRLLIKDAKSFEGRPDKPQTGKSSGGNPPNKRIYVGNLGFDITQGELEQHFSKCGAVADVHVATFEDSGKCKGFAWVTFSDQEAASAAVQGWVMVEDESGDGEEQEAGPAKKRKKGRKWWVNRIKGRPVKAEFAESKSERYKKRFGKGGGGGKGRNGHYTETAEGVGSEIDYTLGSNEPSTV
ncbi:MAG: hypothetical protein M1814_004981 [Vezdaea aestivalis]|nr:MAG: hypothetical protein M1814_004981 [Vezdaea aestivalis]